MCSAGAQAFFHQVALEMVVKMLVTCLRSSTLGINLQEMEQLQLQLKSLEAQQLRNVSDACVHTEGQPLIHVRPSPALSPADPLQGQPSSGSGSTSHDGASPVCPNNGLRPSPALRVELPVAGT